MHFTYVLWLVTLFVNGAGAARVQDDDDGGRREFMEDLPRPLKKQKTAQEEDPWAWTKDLEGAPDVASPDFFWSAPEFASEEEVAENVQWRNRQKLSSSDCIDATGAPLTDYHGYYQCPTGCAGKNLFWSKNSFITKMQGDNRDFAAMDKEIKADNPGGIHRNKKVAGGTMFANVLNMAQGICQQSGHCLYLDWCDVLNNRYNHNWQTENSAEVKAKGWEGSDAGRQTEKNIYNGLDMAVSGYADVFVDTKENQGPFCAAEAEAAKDCRYGAPLIVSIKFEDVIPESTGVKGTSKFGAPPSMGEYPVDTVSSFLVQAFKTCQKKHPKDPRADRECDLAKRYCDYSPR